jgi:hypothetical protein
MTVLGDEETHPTPGMEELAQCADHYPATSADGSGQKLTPLFHHGAAFIALIS